MLQNTESYYNLNDLLIDNVGDLQWYCIDARSDSTKATEMRVMRIREWKLFVMKL